MGVGGAWLAFLMSISDLHPHPGPGAAGGPAGLLAEAVGLVRQAAQAMFAAQPDDALVDTFGLAVQLRAAAAAVEAGALAEADHRDLATKKLAYGSTGDWVIHTGGLRMGEGKRLVARAQALTGPAATWSTWSTPTPKTAGSTGSWRGRNAPPTTTATSPSHPTAPAGSA